MAQRFYKIGIREATFPMLSEQQTRTVLGSEAGKAPAVEERPGVAYCHNVMPTEYGLNSVGYLSVIPAAGLAVLPLGLVFTDVRVAYGDAKSRLYLGWDDIGRVYALLSGATAWIALPATIPATGGPGFSSNSVTLGTVNGVSYILYSTIGAFTYNEVTNKLDNVTLTGLNIAEILGVVASSGYLVAYTNQAIAWSSTILPTDFVPSTVTGAGGGNVAGIAGAIIFCTSNTLGILVYTAANTLAGTYTGNTQFPFKFREIEDSKGGINLDRVAYEANSRTQFVFSKAGLQSISSQRAEAILPDVTDFLAGKRLEDYNETTKLYERTNLGASVTMLKKIKYIASRYLVISYGITSFTHALVFDTALSRLGKLRIGHVDVFEYVDAQTEISKESIAFVLSTGEVQVVDFSVEATNSFGVVILGKAQFSRTRFINLLGVEVENIDESSSLTVSSQVSLDGKNFTDVVGTLDESNENFREYHFRSQAKNHSIVFLGKFNLVSAILRYSTAGKR